jgi:hypothetical protein
LPHSIETVDCKPNKFGDFLSYCIQFEISSYYSEAYIYLEAIEEMIALSIPKIKMLFLIQPLSKEEI